MPEPTATPAPQQSPPTEGIVTPQQAREDIGAAPETGEDWQSKFAGQQKVNRDLERKLKESSAEIEKARAASMSEAEKAVAEAEKRGESKASERFAARLVDESFRAATVGRLLAPDALLSFDRKSFITEDGDVDREGLVKWVEVNAAPTEAPRLPSFDGGARTTAPASAGMNGLIRKATGRA